MVYIGRVINNTDNDGTERIHVYIGGLDNDEIVNDEKLAFPLLPKFFFVKPKIGENVVIVGLPSATSDEPMVRLYLGPIISQPQDMLENIGIQSLAGMGLANASLKRNPNFTPGCDGSFAKPNEVALYGRDKTDIILGDDSVRIRCGARLSSFDTNGKTLSFNSINSAFMHMAYYDYAINVEKIGWDDNKKKLVKKTAKVGSVATISAEEINLVGSSNLPRNPLSKPGSEMLGDYEISEIIEKGHPMVYGDKLVEVLNIFRDAIYDHVHDWGPSPARKNAGVELKPLEELKFKEILSDNVRVL